MIRALLCLAIAFGLAAETSVPVAPLADGCTVTPAGCGDTIYARLAAGDCTASDGAYLDAYSFPGETGKDVVITLRPLSGTYTEPILSLLPPSTNKAEAPFILGGPFATIWFPMTAGTWGIGVGTDQPFASGDYALHLDCMNSAGVPSGCVPQDLACNQIVGWTLDSKSCGIPNNIRYSWWLIYGAAGDSLRLDMASADFSPEFWIEHESGRHAKFSTKVGSDAATMKFTVPEGGWYFIGAAGREPNASGFYALQSTCVSSGCLFPLLRGTLPDMTVSAGSRPFISPVINYRGDPLSLSIFDSESGKIIASAEGKHVQMPEVRTRKRVYVRAENACGWTDSNVFTVQPDSTPKRRAVRK